MVRLRNDIAREVGMSSRISPAAPMAMTRRSRGHGHVIVSILTTSLRIHLVIYIQKSHSLSYIAFVKCATVQTDLEMKPSFSSAGTGCKKVGQSPSVAIQRTKSV